MTFKKEYFDFIVDLKPEQIETLKINREKYIELANSIYDIECVTDDMRERALEHLLVSLNLLNNGICKFY